MRLDYLSASIVPSRAANSVHVMKMCAAFTRRGHRVSLYCRTTPGSTGDVGEIYGVDAEFELVRVHWPAVRFVGGPLYATRVRREMRRRPKADLRYGRDLYSCLAASYDDVPIVYEAHTPPSSAAVRWIQARLFARPSFERLVVISRALGDEYRRLFPWLAAHKILVAHDAADLPGDTAPAANGSHATAVTVGYVGGLYPGKGVELVLRVAELCPRTRFVVVGGSEKEIQYWRQETSAQNLEFRGWVAPADVGSVLREFDIAVAPYQSRVSTYGGRSNDVSRWMSPLKLFEYMAHGCAVICSDLPVLREIVQDGENGLLRDPDRPEDWAQAIGQLEQDPELRHSLGAGARAFATRHTWDERSSRVLARL